MTRKRITSRREKAEAYAKRNYLDAREAFHEIDITSEQRSFIKKTLRAAFLAGWNARARAEKKRRGN